MPVALVGVKVVENEAGGDIDSSVILTVHLPLSVQLTAAEITSPGLSSISGHAGAGLLPDPLGHACSKSKG